MTSADLTIFYNILFYMCLQYTNDRLDNSKNQQFTKNMYVFMNDSNKKFRVGGFSRKKMMHGRLTLSTHTFFVTLSYISTIHGILDIHQVGCDIFKENHSATSSISL